ncbi:MAG: hypothetical protein R6W70_05575 [bacterium]
MKHLFHLIFSALLISTLIVSFSCGSNDDGNGGESASNSSFDGTVGEEDVQHESDETEEGKFSAQIAGNVISIYLFPDPSTFITIIGETDEENTLPGNLKLQDVTLQTTSDIFSYKSGSVKLNSCPSSINDTFTGTMNNVVVESETNSETKTISGDFSVTVLNVANAELHCSGGSSEEDTTSGDECGLSEDHCEGGDCCPYVDCVNLCVYEDCLSLCEDPGKIGECMQCMMDCDSGCEEEHMTDACQTKMNALEKCMGENGCESLATEEDIACSRKHCCSEMEAAFSD